MWALGTCGEPTVNEVKANTPSKGITPLLPGCDGLVVDAARVVGTYGEPNEVKANTPLEKHYR